MPIHLSGLRGTEGNPLIVDMAWIRRRFDIRTPHPWIVGGVTAEDCRWVTFMGLKVRGGVINLLMVNNRDCSVLGGVFAHPDGGLPDADDPETHNVQDDKGRRNKIIGVTCKSASPSGDAISIYNSIGDVVENCAITNELAPLAHAIIIDGGDGGKIRVNNNEVPWGARLGFFGGLDHYLGHTRLKETPTGSGAIEVSDQWYGSPVGVTIDGVRGPLLYQKGRVNVSLVGGSRFGETEIEA